MPKKDSNNQNNISVEHLKHLQETFIAITSHKFLSPLTVIKWNVELLEDSKSLNQLDREKIIDIKNNVQKLDDLTKLLLRIYEVATTPSAGSFKNYSPSEIIKSIIQEYKLLIAQNKIEIINNVSTDETFHLPGSEYFMREILRSVIENAITYNVKEGKVRIDLSKTKTAIKITIQDTGIGIPESDQALIFNPFYRGSNVMKMSFQGNGLCLYMSKIGLNLVKGDIRFSSIPGQGSKFELVFPILES